MMRKLQRNKKKKRKINMKITNEKLEFEKMKLEVERLRKELRKKKKYGLVWEDKPEDVVEMCKEKLPVLKEVKSKEIITDKTKPVNLLIEGDNYHALSVLNYTHKGKIDVIYIDPPYNTGNKDFIYNDSYVEKEDSYRHSKWISFMVKRLKLAKNLLKDTGVIFISIDDNEIAQLKLLMDNTDLFGEQNFVDCISWEKKSSAKGVPPKNMIVNVHEYILVYQKSNKFSFVGEPRSAEGFSNSDHDPRGPWRNTNIKSTVKDKSHAFTIIDPFTGNSFTDTWAFSKDELTRLIKEKYLIFPKNKNGQVRKKEFYNEFKNANIPLKSSWGLFDNQRNTEMLKEILGDALFLNPKPLDLLIYLLESTMNKNSIVLDFMAGSGTTAHALLKINKKDSGNRKFILCTNNENNNGNGHKIAEDICYPRIKKIIEGYKNSNGEKVEGLGGNLKYFKTGFVAAEPNDTNKTKLTKEAVEMLCIKEGTFEAVVEETDLKIFKNHDHHCAIIFDEAMIPKFKQKLKKLDGKCSVYIFSLGDDTFDDEFEDVKGKVKLSPIPEAILRVYRRIFK
ncbi:MAG: Methyltransferase [Parcubacteria group bacterium GW2011_GWA2_47_26]|uniref:Methyltransferase n=1 Tax=Candidatus Magasanikbacteria bacterium GW2011_GWC2_45_8 TaxID=1619050 RepID=A0A0G1QVW4_9BACT|nr:MAG: Methyltransferase [Candidatus Magasanikbacteria bacterium GW2011_GWC2_45_8]KKU73805.1 MAG: Methyltransferase [Parcubacteria group bacterium GW2011_GWA2_47_26]